MPAPIGSYNLEDLLRQTSNRARADGFNSPAYDRYSDMAANRESTNRAMENTFGQRYAARTALYQTQNFLNTSAQALIGGGGIAVNPMAGVGATTGTLMQMQQMYQIQTNQNTAGFRAGTFNQTDIDRHITPLLSSMGFNKSELQSYMRDLATLSGTVSKNLDRATMSVMAFAKANGMDVGQTAAFVGQAVGQSSTLNFNNPGTLLRFTAQMKAMAGNNGALSGAYEAAAVDIQSRVNASGQLANTDDVTSLMAGLRELNPAFYGTAAGAGVMASMIGQAQSATGTNPLLLVRAQQRLHAMGRAGKGANAAQNKEWANADLVTTLKYIDADQKDLIAGGIEDQAKISPLYFGVVARTAPAALLDQVRRNHGVLSNAVRAGAPFNPSDTSTQANFGQSTAVTTSVEQANAQLANATMETAGILKAMNTNIGNFFIAHGSTPGSMIALAGASSTVNALFDYGQYRLYTGKSLVPKFGKGAAEEGAEAVEGAEGGGLAGGALGTGLAIAAAGYLGYSIGNWMLPYLQSTGSAASQATAAADLRAAGVNDTIVGAGSTMSAAFAAATNNRYHLKLSSGLRTRGHNADVGGVQDSQHLAGPDGKASAADFQIIDNSTGQPSADAVAEAILTAIGKQLPGVTGIPEFGPGQGTAPHMHLQMNREAAQAMKTATDSTYNFAKVVKMSSDSLTSHLLVRGPGVRPGITR